MATRETVTREHTQPIMIVLFAAFGILSLAKGVSGLWA